MFLRLRRMLRAAGRDALVLWYASRHPATPRKLKLAALALALYVVSPIDLATDTIPFLGWIDDVSLLALGIPALLKMMPAEVLASARAAAGRLRIWPGRDQA